MEESILTSIKKLLGISEEYENFDTDIIIYINTVFAVLNQLGVGPAKGYRIKDSSNVWSEFIPADDPRFEHVKTYTYLRVRTLFDPPSTSSIQNAMKMVQDELEFRITITPEINSTEEAENQNGS